MKTQQSDPVTFDAEKINHLVKLTKEKSYRMPSGMTREQRRQWAKEVRKQG